MQNPILSDKQWMVCSGVLSAGTGRKMTADQLEVYFDLLNDIPGEVLLTACRRAIQEQRDNWLPSVGVIRSFASECINGQLPQYSEEWDKVRKAVSRFGYPRPAEGMASLSPLSQQAVRAVGGWMVLCDSEQPTIVAAQFRNAYEAAAKRELEMRRISPELRPVITAGPTMTPRLHDERRDEIRGIVGNTAKMMKNAGEPAA